MTLKISTAASPQGDTLVITLVRPVCSPGEVVHAANDAAAIPRSRRWCRMIGLGRTGDARPPVWLGAGLIWWRPGRVWRALGGIHLATDGWQNVASRLACAAPVEARRCGGPCGR